MIFHFHNDVGADGKVARWPQCQQHLSDGLAAGADRGATAKTEQTLSSDWGHPADTHDDSHRDHAESRA
jgi:hypothetical protein